MNAFLTSLILSASLLAAPDGPDRPTMTVRINDQPVCLTIDTGSDGLSLFSSAADRIGLKYGKASQASDPNRMKPGRVPLLRSEPCRLQLADPDPSPLKVTNVQGRRRISILEIPPGLQFTGIDGIIGWPNLWWGILHIDWGQKVLEPLSEVPDHARQWREFKLRPPWAVRLLALEAPESPDPKRRSIYIDTGDPGGVRVCSSLWQQMVSQHPETPMAIEAWYTPAAGCVAQKICWLKTLEIGGLRLYDVPVSEMPPALERGHSSCVAFIGLYGLTRLELVVDARRRHRAYVRTRRDYSLRYDYNRSGVAFVPARDTSSDLVATVLEGSPAYEAGIRNGDKLLRVNGRDVTGWRTDPNVTNSPPASNQPAGTKVNLTIRRETQTMEMTVVLKELLPVEAALPDPDPRAQEKSEKR